MRWDHVFDNDHIPRKFFFGVRAINGDFKAPVTEVLRELFCRHLLREHNSEVDVTWPSESVTFGLHSPEHIAGIIVGMDHRSVVLSMRSVAVDQFEPSCFL